MKYTKLNTQKFEIHQLVLDKIAPSSRVLELGCATGYFSQELKKKGCFVTGVDVEKSAVQQAKEWCDEAFVGDLEHPSTLQIGNKKYDYVLLMDVIEHVINREQLLTTIQRFLKADGKLILTTPNVAHLSIRLKLLRGDFPYTKWGIMDETHVHFFTRSTLLEFLKNQKYIITDCIGSADFGQIPLLGRFLRHIPKSIQFWITKQVPTLLSVQTMVIAEV